MNKDQFFEFVDNPNTIENNSLNDIKDILDTFPYFHTAHLLFLKGLHTNKSMKFDIQLPKSATYIPDRKKLFKLLFYSNVTDKRESISEKLMFEDNLKEVAAKESRIDTKEEPIELLSFKFDNQESKSEDPKSRIQDIDYSFSSEVSDTAIELDYFSGYNIEDLEPSDDVYLNSFYTFEEWIKLVKGKSKEKMPLSSGKKENHKQTKLIDSFIKQRPKIVVKEDAEIKTEDVSKNSLSEPNEFITETLARVYVQQGYLDKAVFAYKKLSLKYPEKNIYFASQIEKLEKLIKEQ